MDRTVTRGWRERLLFNRQDGKPVHQSTATAPARDPPLELNLREPDDPNPRLFLTPVLTSILYKNGGNAGNA